MLSNLKWRLFKWIATKHIERVSREMGMEGLAYIFIIGLSFNFKELIFDKYGFFASFKYAFDLELQKEEKNKWYNSIDTEFRLSTDKQIVLEDRRYLIFDGEDMGYDYAKVDEDGFLRNMGRRTQYFFDFSQKILYFDTIHKIGTLEEIEDWTIVYILPH